jgi:AcrR family transcriptional regulator
VCRPLRQIKVADIAEVAGVSTSTFYLYFADVDAAVLTLLTDLAADMPDFAGQVRAIAYAEMESGVRAMLAVYLDFWDSHYALLRVRNLAADEGEPRFREMRGRMLGPLLDALTDKLIEMRGPTIGSEATPAIALAALISGSMERLAALVRVREAQPELARKPLIDAEVVLLCEMLRGPAAG